MPGRASDRLLIFSSDGHVGPPVECYRDYVEPGFRNDFDEWLAGYEALWVATREKDAKLPPTFSETYKRQWMQQEGFTPAVEAKWDAHVRLEILDKNGLVGDVIFPDDQSANSVPFAGLTREFNRRWDEEFSPELKLAGSRAYNRWLADFCSAAPERLLGVAFLGTLADVDAAIEEVRWAKENGINGGVLLPLHYYNTAEAFYNDRRYDRFWAACADLGMPLHTHNGSGSPYYGAGVDAPILYAMECTYWPHRPLWFLIVGGVFERNPGLKLMLTEQGSIWIIEALIMLDMLVTDPKFAYHEQGVLTLKPSEYFERQCWLGASIVSRVELEQRHLIGVEKLMWGWDHPHIESSDWMHPQEKLRELMKGFPEGEVSAIVGGNAVEAYDLDVAPLLKIAERVGPAVGEIVST